MVSKSEMSEEEAIAYEKSEIRLLKSNIAEVEETIKNSPSKHSKEYINCKQVKKNLIKSLKEDFGLDYNEVDHKIYNGWNREV
jgi:hypothetical protein